MRNVEGQGLRPSPHRKKLSRLHRFLGGKEATWTNLDSFRSLGIRAKFRASGYLHRPEAISLLALPACPNETIRATQTFFIASRAGLR